MIKQKYNTARIQLLYQMLVSSHQQGHPREYDIKVDELKVVQRTADPEQFFTHEEFILPDTQTVTITLYEGTSNRNARHLFILNEPEKEKDTKNTLEGVEQLVKEKITGERRQWEYEQMQKENEALKRQLAESEEYSDDLQEKLLTLKGEFEEFKKKRIGLSEMNIGRTVGFATEYFTKNHPHLAKKIPLLSALSGFLNDEEASSEPIGNTPDSQQSSPETQASYTKKRTETSEAGYDPDTRNKLAFFKQMEEAFDAEQFAKVVRIVQMLAVRLDQIDSICELLEMPQDTPQS